MNYLEEVEKEVSSWEGVSCFAHRFGGREFRVGTAEIGHIHTGGVVDIPFPRSIHDVLLKRGLAQRHHWLPNSGWITFHIANEEGFTHALWLFRLSYLRYQLRNAAAPRLLLDESERLWLTPEFKSLLMQLLPVTGAPALDSRAS